MPSMDSVTVGGPSLILAKGEPGTGKSIAAASYALQGPLYFFDFEDKMASVKNYYTNIVKRPDVLKNITFDVHRNWDNAWIKITQFGIQCPHKYLVWDSLTSSAWLAMWGIAAEKGFPKKAGKISVASVEDYGGEASGLMQLMDQFITLRRMGITVIMTAHVLQVVEKQLGQPATFSRVLMTGGKKVAAFLPGTFHETYHFQMDAMDLNNLKYEVITKHSGDDFARTSLPLPQKIEWTNKIFYEEVQKALKLNV